MNYKSCTILQFKKLLNNSFHSIKIELRDITGEKIPFVSVDFTQVVLLISKILNNQCSFKRQAFCCSKFS